MGFPIGRASCNCKTVWHLQVHLELQLRSLCQYLRNFWSTGIQAMSVTDQGTTTTHMGFYQISPWTSPLIPLTCIIELEPVLKSNLEVRILLICCHQEQLDQNNDTCNALSCRLQNNVSIQTISNEIKNDVWMYWIDYMFDVDIPLAYVRSNWLSHCRL